MKQFISLVIVFFIGVLPCLAGSLSFGTHCVERNMIAELAVEVSTGASTLSQLGFTINYDPERLEFIGCHPGDVEPVGGWDQLEATEVAPGQLEVYAYSESSVIPTSTNDVLFYVDLCYFYQEGSPGDIMPIEYSNLMYDLAGFTSNDSFLEQGFG